LFNIYVSKLPQCVPSPVVQLADDITISESDRNVGVVLSKLSEAFKKTKDFCSNQQLVINSSKTQFILFKSAGKKIDHGLNINIDGCLIAPTNSVKL